jgi:hypothetical protein
MPHRLPVLLAVLALAGAHAAAAQSPAARPSSSSGSPQASVLAGRFEGIVRDDAGSAIDGVSIVALGTTLAVARTDGDGRFNLVLPVGEYIVRASREGYISTYREPIRVQSNLALQRTIRLLRATDGHAAETVRDPAASSSEPPSEIAWRLRHLTRTVLRDESPVPADVDRFGTQEVIADLGRGRALNVVPSVSDLSGQLNLVAASSLADPGTGQLNRWTREIAYFAIGAPVGSAGAWAMRAAMAPGDTNSWTLLGQYESSPNQIHAVKVGVSYSTQAFVTPSRTPVLLPEAASRSVGAVYGSDRWRIADGLDLDYALRVERYDYLLTPNLVSPSVGARLRVAPGTYVRVRGEDRLVAPGSDQFVAPASGPWLPPERTFSPLTSEQPLGVEHVHSREIGIDRDLDATSARTIGIAWFRESTANQLATLFGLDADKELGRYYVAPAGDVAVSGWRVKVGGRLLPFVRGALTYSHGRAFWTDTVDARVLRRVMPSAAPEEGQTLHQLAAMLDIAVPESATTLTFAYRLDNGFTTGDPIDRTPAIRGRMNLEVRQKLPYQPTPGSELNLVFTLRTLLRDVDAGAYYDELLTARPPTRVTGGVQVRF